MKKLFTLLAVATFGCYFGAVAQVQTQDFESTADSSLPTGWSQVSTAANAWKTGINTFLQSTDFPINAHTKMVAVNDDKAGSSGAGSDNSNDLLISNTINLSTVTTPFLSFDLYYFASTYSGVTESLTLVISTDGGTTWTNLATVAGNTVTPWETRYYSLAAYSTQTNVKIGFRYNDGGGWLFGAALDNISIFTPLANDLALSAITPVAGSPGSYGVSGGNINMGGTVFNNSSNTVTSFTVKYKQGTNAAVSDAITGVNIAPFTSYNFTHNVPYTVPSVSTLPMKMWVELAGDNTHTNDTLNTSIVGAAFLPTKRLVIEEATGTWCGWCVRGALYMDSMSQVHPNNVSLVAVHNADPMTVAAYDAAITSLPSFSGFPTIVIDRRETDDPSNIFTVYNKENNYFGYADVTLGNTNLSGNNLSIPITVKPAVNLTGDYRLALVVTENRVHSNTSGGTWDQHNYYSGQPNSGNYALPTSSVFGDFHNLPNPIPANTFYYDAVGRGVYPSVNGTAGLLPSSMTAGTNYTQTITATLDPSWVQSNLHAVVMLIDGATGYVLNSNNVKLTTSVTNIDAGLEQINVYPNPTSNVANVKFNLTETSNVQIQMIDAVGKVVYSKEQHMNNGTQLISIPTNNMANGLYNIKIQTEKGAQTVCLTVIK